MVDVASVLRALEEDANDADLLGAALGNSLERESVAAAEIVLEPCFTE